MLVRVLAAALLFVTAQASKANDYPNRTVTLVVPLGAGSGTDIMARTLAEGLAEKLGQPFVVENRPGANGIPATDYVGRSSNDGYTLMMGGNTTHSANPHLFRDLKYDPLRDFTPIASIAGAGAVLIVSPKSKMKNIADLVREAKSNPRGMNYGSPNSGAQIATETLKKTFGIEITRVPYRATPQAMTDVIAGAITMTFVDVASALSAVNGGQVRALAITSGKRSPLLPDVPTMSEEGVRNFDLTYWSGLFGPANLPKEVVGKLDGAIKEIMTQEKMLERLTKLGLTPSFIPAANMPSYLRTELDRWGHFVKEAGIEVN